MYQVPDSGYDIPLGGAKLQHQYKLGPYRGVHESRLLGDICVEFALLGQGRLAGH